MVSKNIIVLKACWIFAFWNDTILSFFTYSRLWLHFTPKFSSNFILMSFDKQCRIYRSFQIRSLGWNPTILSWDIPIFLAQLLSNRHFQEKSMNSKIYKIRILKKKIQKSFERSFWKGSITKRTNPQ